LQINALFTARILSGRLLGRRIVNDVDCCC